MPYLPATSSADKTPASHRSPAELDEGAKGRGIEGRDVSACRSSLFILSPADTSAMILTRRGEAFSPRCSPRGRKRWREGARRYVAWVAESFFSTLFEGKARRVYNGENGVSQGEGGRTFLTDFRKRRERDGRRWISLGSKTAEETAFMGF